MTTRRRCRWISPCSSNSFKVSTTQVRLTPTTYVLNKRGDSLNRPHHLLFLKKLDFFFDKIYSRFKMRQHA